MNVASLRRPGVAQTERPRVLAIDVLRGLAIVLMVLDHVLVQVDSDSLVRSTVTRFALPLFMFAAAAVWHEFPRVGRLFVVAVVEAFLYPYLGMGTPGIVTVYVGLLGVLDVVGVWIDLRRPYLLGVVGLVQALYVPIGWSGYEPGLVLAWWCLARCYLASEPTIRLPAWLGPLGVVGRHPLVWYVGHLLVIALAVAVL